jgi:hypothetical protein
MTNKEIETFFELLDKFINENGPWIKKRANLLSMASSDDKTNLEEFIGWFEERDEE